MLVYHPLSKRIVPWTVIIPLKHARLVPRLFMDGLVKEKWKNGFAKTGVRLMLELKPVHGWQDKKEITHLHMLTQQRLFRIRSSAMRTWIWLIRGMNRGIVSIKSTLVKEGALANFTGHPFCLWSVLERFVRRYSLLGSFSPAVCRCVLFQNSWFVIWPFLLLRMSWWALLLRFLARTLLSSSVRFWNTKNISPELILWFGPVCRLLPHFSRSARTDENRFDGVGTECTLKLIEKIQGNPETWANARYILRHQQLLKHVEQIVDKRRMRNYWRVRHTHESFFPYINGRFRKSFQRVIC